MKNPNMKLLLLFTLCIVSSGNYAQDINARIDSLFSQPREEVIEIAQRILRIDPSNTEAHNKFVSSLMIEERKPEAYAHIDSILQLSNPDPQVLLALVQGMASSAYRNSLYDSYYFKVLNACINYEETRGYAAVTLSRYYYSDFIRPTKKDPPTEWTWEIKMDSVDQYENDLFEAELYGISIDSLRQRRGQIQIPKSEYPNAADSALKYLNILRTSDSPFRNLAQLPIAQLEEHLGIQSTYELDSALKDGHYVPDWYFGYLSEDWKHDKTLDVFNEMMGSFFRVDWMTDFLSAADEPILYPSTDKLTYRITWLPSFHHPIVLRLEKNDSGGWLMWKVNEGMGGNEPLDILEEGSVQITEPEFNRIADLLDSTEICNDYHYDNLSMNDGATLIIERVDEYNFCAHLTNVPYEAIQLLLIELSQSYFPEIDHRIHEYRFSQ